MNVAWSLSYEVLYYILIPLLILALQMRKWSNSQRLGFWIFATLLGFGLFSVIGQHDRLMMFVSGILLYETIKFYDYKPPAWSGTISLLIAIVLVGSDYIQIAGIPTIITSVILFILFYIVCFESLSRSNGSSKWLVYSPLRWLGNISYSYYLIHVLALKGVFLIAYKLWIPSHQFTSIFWYLWIPLFLITGMVSLALYLLVEKPISLRTDKPKTLKESMRRIS
ncbi:MAG: exopolysaccharide production protein ExoZ [Limisphaerales bacterium]